MNHGNQPPSYITQAGNNAYANTAPEPQPTPMTRDLNVLGENIARLDANLDILHKQLAPVIRPASEPSATGGSDKPQLVKARSNMGHSLEGFAASVETLIQRVQFLSGAIEV